jgi:hypothetical protein
LKPTTGMSISAHDGPPTVAHQGVRRRFRTLP